MSCFRKRDPELWLERVVDQVLGLGVEVRSDVELLGELLNFLLR